jgi:hypothetical protein
MIATSLTERIQDRFHRLKLSLSQAGNALCCRVTLAIVTNNPALLEGGFVSNSKSASSQRWMLRL